VWVEKRDLDSNTAGARLADALGLRRRLVSHCGLKDRHAVTRQWFSLHMPGQPSPEPAALESEGLRVLRITRNTRKLRRGIHLGNRFTIRLRHPDFDTVLRRNAGG
jgi:tRNA pseudouridine13 synthase